MKVAFMQTILNYLNIIDLIQWRKQKRCIDYNNKLFFSYLFCTYTIVVGNVNLPATINVFEGETERIAIFTVTADSDNTIQDYTLANHHHGAPFVIDSASKFKLICVCSYFKQTSFLSISN